MKKIVLLLVTCCSGCGAGWIKPGGTTAELSQDRYQCEQEAVKMYPVLMVPYSKGQAHQTAARTNCNTQGDNMSCTSMPSVYTPPELHMRDANKNNRDTAVHSCLKSRGYEFQWGNVY